MGIFVLLRPSVYIHPSLYRRVSSSFKKIYYCFCRFLWLFPPSICVYSAFIKPFTPVSSNHAVQTPLHNFSWLLPPLPRPHGSVGGLSWQNRIGSWQAGSSPSFDSPRVRTLAPVYLMYSTPPGIFTWYSQHPGASWQKTGLAHGIPWLLPFSLHGMLGHLVVPTRESLSFTVFYQW